MYEYIEGELVAKSPTAVVLDVAGVGYRLYVPLSTFRRLPERGRVKLLAYLYVREEILRLYGFATEAEREVFLRLLSVPKIGPSVALAVLSGISLAQLREAIVNRQPAVLSRVKGIGKATAERIVQELQRDFPLDFGAGEGAPASKGKARDVVAALLTLGYQRSVAERAAVKSVDALSDDAALEALVTEALKNV